MNTVNLNFGLLGFGTVRQQTPVVFKPLNLYYYVIGSPGTLRQHLFIFFHQFEIFVILGMMTDFQVKPRHLGYYVVRLPIVFKPSVLANFL